MCPFRTLSNRFYTGLELLNCWNEFQGSVIVGTLNRINSRP